MTEKELGLASKELGIPIGELKEIRKEQRERRLGKAGQFGLRVGSFR